MATNHFGGLDVAPAIAGCSGRGAIAGSHRRAPW